MMNMLDCNDVPTPVVHGIKLNKGVGDKIVLSMNGIDYRSIVGRLLWISGSTVPLIAYAVCMLRIF